MATQIKMLVIGLTLAITIFLGGSNFTMGLAAATPTPAASTTTRIDPGFHIKISVTDPAFYIKSTVKSPDPNFYKSTGK